jgi:NAD(P)-dependent dehydrogenase (short-subunit alcohol dehydrogenase family)
MPTDVTSYASLLALFDKALTTYGRVDVAISNAGILERPGWFESSINLDSVRTAPSTAVLDVNLTGTLYFARIAAVYLRQSAAVTDDKSLLLLSSVAGFEESPGLFVYQAAKHGVLGLMRSLRKYFPGAYGEPGIRVNCVCPWATETAMVRTFADAWKEQGLPMNSSEGVASIIVGVSADDRVHGESVYVEGDRGWLIEEGLARTHPEWLGEAAASSLAKGQEFLGNGYKWT